MLEIAESGFNAPALVIHFLEFSRREGIPVQIGNQAFPDTGGDFNGKHAKIKWVIELVFQITEVKAGFFREDAIEGWIRFDQFGLLSGQDDVKVEIESGIQGKLQLVEYTVIVRLFDADEIVHIALGDMREHIVAFIATIGSENRSFIKGETVNHCYESTDFIRLTAGLDERVGITPTTQIIQRVQMQQVIAPRLLLGNIIVFGFTGIGGIMQVGSIAGNQPVPIHTCTAWEGSNDL